MHRRGRHAFYYDLLEPRTHAQQQDSATGEIIWAAAGSWGQILFFMFIGLVLFVEFVLIFVPNLARQRGHEKN